MSSDTAHRSDQDLACLAQAGSLTAFEELVFRYEARIYSFARHCGCSDADAREVTQDTFVRAFLAMAQFNSQHPFAPWLFTIARRKYIDHRRRALPISDEPVPEQPDSTTPATVMTAREERDRLWQLAQLHLSELQFQALWLRYAEEMSVADIARVLRRTQTHVKVLLFRARQILARELTPFAGELSGPPPPAKATPPAGVSTVAVVLKPGGPLPL